MSKPQFVSIAEGKPRRVPTRINGDDAYSSIEVDLLWRYPIDLLILDRWGEGTTDTGDNTDVVIPGLLIEVSNDGSNWATVESGNNRWTSWKGSKGTLRSVRIDFAKTCSARYIRLAVAKSFAEEFDIRVLLTNLQTRTAEKAKLVELGRFPKTRSSSRDPIKVGVLGGSNSVMRFGWVRGLADASIDVAWNNSLGSSSNAVLHTRLNGQSSEGAEVLLLNSTVNEYRSFRDGTANERIANQFIRSVQEWAFEVGTIPIFIIYPQLRVFEDEMGGRRVFDQEQYYAQICEDLRMPYINVFAVLRDLASYWRRSLPSLYLDLHHVNHAAAQVLGTVIGETVRDFLRGSGEPALQEANTKAYGFDTIKLAEINDGQGLRATRNIRNSIVDDNFVTIEEDEELNIALDPGAEVVAYTVNARNCNASIEIAGWDTVCRRVDFNQFRGEQGAPMVCTRTLRNSVFVGPSGTITVRAVAPMSNHEADEITNPQMDEHPTRPLRVEISELVVRRPTALQRFARVETSSLDLTDRAVTILRTLIGAES